ncbi:PREDICTED: putative uncharacterized protein DDB_G0277255 [Rhagoletis zephyria]|nr:PREDICTED: putative uncharacterized protein DDB_G0277255 [Rhagoletis zephyria]
MFSGFSISPPTKQSSAPSQGIQQLKLKSNNDALKISHTSSPKPDILSSLMNSNISNLSNSSSPKSSVAPTSAMSPIVNPYTSPGSNVTSPNQSHSTDAWTNNWHSANPLVMNHQLASPQANNSSNNNSSSLDKLNPFGGGNKSASVQRQVVNYIYPSGYNSSGASGISNGNSMSSLNNMNNLTPLIPQQNAAQKQAQDNKNLNTLSQQDILSFLN